MTTEQRITLASVERTTEQVLNDPSSSYWLSGSLRSALKRDPVDALADAEQLVNLLKDRLEALQGR